MPRKKDMFEELYGDGETTNPTTPTTGSTVIVPNVFPIITNTPYRIAILGEAPGSDEVSERTPFVGPSGRALSNYLSKVGILRDACYIGNICQYQPYGNKIANFDWNGPEIQQGLSVLAADLSSFKPNIVWLLGATALHAFKEGVHSTPRGKRKTKNGLAFVLPNAIGDWRGSLFLSSNDSPYPNCKCVASYHPAAAMRTYDWMPLILLDLLFKVCKEANTPTLELPVRDLRVNLSLDETLSEMRKIRCDRPLTSVDIEGGVGTMSCLSLATSPSFSFIVPFTTLTGQSLWSLNEELLLWKELIAILGDPHIPKVLQNSLYDRFVLQYSYGIIVRGVVDDTMLKHWELYPELEKSLGFQCSLYTNEPYYKSDRKSNNRETFWEYCCRDSATTHEINGKLEKWVHNVSREHYTFNVTLLNALMYMEMRGFRYDASLAQQRKQRIDEQIWELQSKLDAIAGKGLHESTTTEHALKLVQTAICYKNDPNRPKAGYENSYKRCLAMLKTGLTITSSQAGYLGGLLKLSLNTKSPEFKTFLYETLKLPPQYKEDDSGKRTLTTDYVALLKLLTRHATNDVQRRSLELAISIGELRTRTQMLAIHADRDGRIRAGYNIVGTETSRITCYTSPTGSGYNLQTIPEENTLREANDPLREGMRELFIADEGCFLFKCDLSGADGWTIGAHLYALGRPMMLEDLRAGIKPAQRVAYMLRHGTESLKGKPRDEVKHLLKEIKKSDWDYFGCKVGIWGICYLMGPDLLADVILKNSEGKVYKSRKEMVEFKNAVFAAYEPNVWHDAVGRKLKNQPYPPKLTSASGHTRKFFGRPTDVLGQALANEPQENTTYAVKKALYRLWHDPENRETSVLLGNRQCNRLRVEPLHTVHDSLDGQFRISDTAWAVDKVKSWFDNPLIIAGQRITIPFSGSYGTNWAMDDNSKVGDI